MGTTGPHRSRASPPPPKGKAWLAWHGMASFGMARLQMGTPTAVQLGSWVHTLNPSTTPPGTAWTMVQGAHSGLDPKATLPENVVRR